MPDTQLIKITLNGKPSQIQAGMTVADLLTKWKIRPELVTVEVNETILQKLDYDNTGLKEGDKVEFVFYMGGGSAKKYWTVAPARHKASASPSTNRADACGRARRDLWRAGPVGRKKES